MQVVDGMSALQDYYIYWYMCVLLVEKPFQIQNNVKVKVKIILSDSFNIKTFEESNRNV